MSVALTDFQGEIFLIGLKWFRAGYAPMGAELTAIATALGTDPTVHDRTIEAPPPGTKIGAAQTACTNSFLLSVNKGKGGNLANAAMATAINNAVAQYLFPICTVLPVASGTGTVGSVLSCTQGTWANAPTGYAYQWLRGGSPIGGATAATYTLVTADGGTSVSCRVTATNVSGSTPEPSNAISVQGVPATVVAPVASGTGTVGQVLSTNNGTWTNAPTSYVYSWQRNTVTIGGAAAATYTLQAADSGTNVRSAVQAVNAAGSSVVVPSNAIAVA